jgi:ATP-dependent helicase YprA (DUF1998 family)
MQKVKSKPIFEFRAKPVLKALVELGFSKPTLPQVMVVPPLFVSKDILLVASTGSRKTESVLPVFSRCIQQKEGCGSRYCVEDSGEYYPTGTSFIWICLRKIQFLRAREFWNDWKQRLIL